MSHRTPALLAAGAIGLLALAGCAGGPSSAETPGDDGIRVVASTNVYGDVAETIGGDRVQVRSIIDSPDKDPHEYQATARDQLAISKAAVVIENGGGYDDFVDRMLSASGNDDATVLTAVDISGHDQDPADGEFNEHVWYDIPTVAALADHLAGALSKAEPEASGTFEKNANVLRSKLAVLETTEGELKSAFGGEGVAVTEPVPGYLLDAVGLVNKTPEPFREAVEEGRDVAPRVLAQVLDLFADGSVRLLVYNQQAGGPQIDRVIDAAEKHSVPAVGVTETLPAGEHYVSWMSSNLDAIGSALKTGG